MASTKITIVPPLYKRILSRFPQNFTFCFAYGSAVKKQLGNNSSEDLIDLIFCVNNPSAWHEANLKHNFSHYSGLKYFGHNFVARFQQNVGAKVYFNTLVPLDDDIWIKYGVVATEDLVTDLLEWSDLYLAGRLHKPVEIIKKPLSTELETALQLNLQSAVHAALLILPHSFTEYEFYHTVSHLSYGGDFRMTFGENKNKVENIVRPQLLGFRRLYKPFILSLPDYVEFPVFKGDGNLSQTDAENLDLKLLDPNEVPVYCIQDVSPIARLHHLNQLPRWPQKALTRFWNRGTLRQDTEDVLRAIAYDPDCGHIVKQCVSDIVWKSSVSQSLKGIATAGLLKSVRYSSRKIKKIMYQFSDSDSVDSDDGIRYKTDSIRNKDRCVRRDSPSKSSGNRDRRERKRSRSRSPKHREKRTDTKRHKRRGSSSDREDALQRSRHKDRRKDKKEEERYKEKRQSRRDVINSGKEKESRDKNVESTSTLNSTKTIGPVLPPNFKREPPEDVPVDTPKEFPDSIGSAPPSNLISHNEEATSSGLLPADNAEPKIIGPALPPNFRKPEVSSPDTTALENTIVGPALPAGLTPPDESEDKTMGPSLPHHLRQKLLEESGNAEEPEEEEVYGPLSPGQGLSRAHVELEERALKMKIDRLEPQDGRQAGREEWMLTLPEVKAARFGLGPRSFRSKEGPDLSDRSSWTETPEDKAKRKAGDVTPKVDLQKEAELVEIKRRDREQEAVAKRNKKHKKSLLEIHQQKLKNDKSESGPSERRPFSREIDLQVNRFDDAQKKAVLKKAQLLDTRFSTGESKYL
ncbi:hypothetical protein NQ318_019824 [Aromia moschata]|uniref:Phosphatidate cytidylyltransferase, mitochondrial n=1 Tax=Aromia moschata TaxID=1265417 RepID=A0AAV8YL18_9CUCU|nr:hypothetical protein NQ318_019824 [Aromia moschata]